MKTFNIHQLKIRNQNKNLQFLDEKQKINHNITEEAHVHAAICGCGCAALHSRLIWIQWI